MTMPILDVCWSDDGTKVFMASCDKQVKCWDLGSNQTVQVAAHDAPIKTCHWVKAPSYTCIMTGSWDKTLKVCYVFFVIIYKYFEVIFHDCTSINIFYYKLFAIDNLYFKYL